MRIVAFLLFPTAAAAFSAGPTATTTATLSSAMGRIHKPPRGLGKTTTTKFGNQYKKSSSSYSLFHRRLQSSMQDGDGLKKRLQLFPLVALVVREWFLLWKSWWMKLKVNIKILPQIQIQKKMKRITAAFLVAATIWIQGIPSLSGGFGTTPDAAHAATMSSTTTAVEQVEPYYNPFSFSSSSWEIMEEDRLLLPAKFASTTATSSSASGSSSTAVVAASAAASAVATTTTTTTAASTTSAASTSPDIAKTAIGAAVLAIPIGATLAYLTDKKKKQQQQEQQQETEAKQEEETDAPTRTISTTPTASPPTTTTLTSTTASPATGEEKTKKYTVVKAKRLTTTSDKNKTNENDDDDATNILKDEILPSQYVFLTVSNALVVACMVPHL